MKSKISVFCTKEDDIAKITSNEEEAAKVRALLDTAEQQSQEKKIRRIRKGNMLIKHLVLLKIYMRYGIHWRKPLYPFRLARNIIFGKIYNLLKLRKYVLRGIEFAITFRCNFRCNHCLCARINESGKRREMDANEYAKIVRDAMKLGATTFGLEGGEPFVSNEWEEVIKAFQPQYNHVIISTNGFLFDEEKAQKCAKLGVDTINFSLDSGIPEIHDAFRRQRGSHAKVVEGIRLCKKYGIKVIINTVVHKGNLYTDGFLKLLEFAEQEKILVNTLLAKGVGNFQEKDAVLDPEDLKAMEEIVRPYNYVQRHLAYNYGKQFGCPGTKEMINMTPYGDVMNCANMHVYQGNVLEEPLAKIREKGLRSPFGLYNPCFLADDRDFMAIYYPLLEKKGHVSLDEFMGAIKVYEKEKGRILYPSMS
ncbi:MAG: radical SAM protein [Deltaproteobacteria bacterium]|nr:radical SAM protein [Deltaproteobacteria bacterium]